MSNSKSESTLDQALITVPLLACCAMVLALLYDAFVVKPW